MWTRSCATLARRDDGPILRFGGVYAINEGDDAAHQPTTAVVEAATPVGS
jgi:hypothetical protein